MDLSARSSRGGAEKSSSPLNLMLDSSLGRGAKLVSQNLACTYRAANSFVPEPKSKMKHPERGSTVTTDRTICQSSQMRFSVSFRKMFVQFYGDQ